MMKKTPNFAPELLFNSMNFKRLIKHFLCLHSSVSKYWWYTFVYLDFELRKEYIIHNLCENRFKPQPLPLTPCDGKCYLVKQLQKVAEDNAPPPPNETQKQSDTTQKLLQKEVCEEINLPFPTVPPNRSARPNFSSPPLSIQCFFPEGTY